VVGVNDRDDPTGTIVAAEVAVGEGEYSQAERALLKALGQVRKARGEAK